MTGSGANAPGAAPDGIGTIAVVHHGQKPKAGETHP